MKGGGKKTTPGPAGIGSYLKNHERSGEVKTGEVAEGQNRGSIFQGKKNTTKA
jgi:hypothetical protein